MECNRYGLLRVNFISQALAVSFASFFASSDRGGRVALFLYKKSDPAVFWECALRIYKKTDHNALSKPQVSALSEFGTYAFQRSTNWT